MKKLYMILAMALFAVAANTGCETNFEGGRMVVINNIYVDPDGWREYTVDGRFSHLYADIEMREITEHIFHKGLYTTYWVYEDNGVEVQVPLEDTIYPGRYLDGYWAKYSETLTCTYSIGNMRLEIRRSDGSPGRPDGRLSFRTVIFW